MIDTKQCHDCGKTATQLHIGDDGYTQRCESCYIAALRYGHVQIGHDDPAADCPLCAGDRNYTVEYGDRGEPREAEEFDDLEDAKIFARNKSKWADIVLVLDENQNEIEF